MFGMSFQIFFFRLMVWTKSECYSRSERNSEHFYLLQNGSERNKKILSVFLFYQIQMVRKGISSIFICSRMVCNEITRFWVFFSSTKWFGTEFQAFSSSAKLFWTKLKNLECFSLLGNGWERNSEFFYLPRNGSEVGTEFWAFPFRGTGGISTEWIKISNRWYGR